MLINIIVLNLIFSDIKPKENLRFQYVQEQGFDSSCGYSTVSTLMNIYWGIPVTEEKLIKEYLPAKLEQKDYSVSLADISKVLGDYGLQNKSFKMTFSQLEKALKRFSPILVHYEKPEKHFALVLGITNTNVITADPARGVALFSKGRFLKYWSGVVLLTASRKRKEKRAVIESAIEHSKRRERLLERWAWQK